MSVTEYERHQIFTWYEEAMGSERATIMMNLVPPVGWGEVATRTDLAALATVMRGEMAELRGEFAGLRGEFAGLRGEFSELRGEFSELRGEMAELRAGLRGEIAELRAELRGEIAELRGEMAELRGGLRGEIAKLRIDLFFAMVASNATLVGLVFAAVKLA